MKIKWHIVLINVLTLVMSGVWVWFAIRLLVIGSVKLSITCIIAILYLILIRVIMMEGK